MLYLDIASFMRPKNLMDEKQLNFNQPLLSVRRGSLAAGPSKVNERKTNSFSPSLPTLPYYKSELKSGPVTNPGVVPFKWEQTPGRPKHEKKDQIETIECHPLAPKLPPGRLVNHKQIPTDNILNDSPASSSRSYAEHNIPCSLETSSVDKVLLELEGIEEGKRDSNSEDENVIYEDARDTLSRTESFFLNCSMSGVSGLDGPNVEPSGAFSDPQTRDFMMGRFLPAAKAVASETPLLTSKKQSMAKELPVPEKKFLTNQFPRYHDIPNTSPHTIHMELQREEEEDEGDEYVEAEHMSAKLCGLLPRFCLLNSIPGMREHTQLSSSVQSVRTRPAYDGLSRKSDNKVGTDNKGEVKRVTRQHGSTNKSFLNADFGRNVFAPQKKGLPWSFLGREQGLLDFSEELRDFRAGNSNSNKNQSTEINGLLAHHCTEECTSPVNPAFEKTLYIDFEQRVESQDSSSSSSESRGRKPSVDYSVQDIKLLCGVDEKTKPRPKNSDIVDTDVFSCSEKLSQDAVEETPKDLQKEQNVRLVMAIQQPQATGAKESTQKGGTQLVMAPLLPKSPSESWLSRTLPSMSSKYPSSKLHPGYHFFKASPVAPKRGRVLKTSNGQHLLFQPPGELAAISEY